jgi:hypothetical protein
MQDNKMIPKLQSDGATGSLLKNAMFAGYQIKNYGERVEEMGEEDLNLE